MSDPGAKSVVRDELARIVVQLGDRFIPPLSEAYKNPDVGTRYVPTFFGTLLWDIGASIYIFRDADFSRSFDILGATLIVAFFSTLLVLNLMFTALIAWSFDRGRPLDFFLRGLIFPTATVVILSFAFPW